MSMPETMAEYLVKLSADVDTNSFNSAATALEGIISKLKGIKELAAAGALVAGFAMVGKAATDAIRDVASADMEFAVWPIPCGLQKTALKHCRQP